MQIKTKKIFFIFRAQRRFDPALRIFFFKFDIKIFGIWKIGYFGKF